MSQPRKQPRYCLHKSSGQARVRINGRDVYLGPHGSPESHERYERLMREWHLRNGNIVAATLTVDELCLRFLEDAEQTYRHPDGTRTGTAENFRHTLKRLIKLHGRSYVREFGPLRLRAVRDLMIEDGLARKHVNREIGRIRQVFRWGVEHELVPPEVYTALTAVSGLRAGRQGVRDTAPVRPVSDADIEATLPYLPAVVADMVRLHRSTGCRPGELCAMRPADIERSDDVWVYVPERHKTAWHGKERCVFIGPEGQNILARYLLRDAERFCFSPADAEADRNAERKAKRQTPVTPSQRARAAKANRNRKRPPLDSYDTNTYAKAVKRGCEKAGIEPWSPNRLRHTKATELRAQFGIESAQVTLGHSTPNTTLIYAEAQFDKARDIARRTG